MTQLTFLPAPLNACDELVNLFAGCHSPLEREQFRTFAANYWMALAEPRRTRAVDYPPEWLPNHLQRITNALHRYADKLGHRIVFDRPLVDNPLDKGVNGIEVRELIPAGEVPLEKLVGLQQKSALDVQVDGAHYKGKKIQPVEYIMANDLNFLEGCIVKRITRWRDKQGYVDLEKIKHEVDLLIELDKKFRKESGGN